MGNRKVNNDQATGGSDRESDKIVVLQKQRKFRFNGQEYVDLGEDGGFFRLLNKNQVVEKVNRERYIQMALAGFDSRLNLNGIDYDTWSQAGLFPVAYTLGTDFKVAARQPVEKFVHWNEW